MIDLTALFNRVGETAKEAVEAESRIVKVARRDGVEVSYAMQRNGSSDSFVELKPQDPTRAKASSLKATTLGAVVTYLKENRDGLDLKKTVVLVHGPRSVQVVGELHPTIRDREAYLHAEPINPDLDRYFDTFMDREDFSLFVQTRFEDSEERAALLKMISHLRTEAIRTAQDDGVSQVASFQKGVSVVNGTVQARWNLVALRTFPEVDMQPSPFTLRLRRVGEGDKADIECGLFESDGGAWRVQAMNGIAAWLADTAGADREWGIIA